MTILDNGKHRKLTGRQVRAFSCVNMREGGFCGSFAEGAPDRRCPIVFPRMMFSPSDEAEIFTDHCPFNGGYGFHTKEKVQK